MYKKKNLQPEMAFKKVVKKMTHLNTEFGKYVQKAKPPPQPEIVKVDLPDSYSPEIHIKVKPRHESAIPYKRS